ncbi:sensor histidine kinase [Nocardioides sp. NPDC057772]|uniref:sensor histidine kinase n=1 Tax=unclassified Nocardioides TaxID=2615069 RepID=UPI0002028CA1|nr:HAMP domain-containing sensor histidine kinase [Nocardioides sp. NBC_00368]EGD42841.1 sensor histidine kinase [Nocardioidaceae bacterium Broad-1]
MRLRQWPIGMRLLVAQALVLLAAIISAAVIAAVVGPPLFHEHMLQADHAPDPSELEHVERAFRTASIVSLGIAVLTAALLAFAVSWFLSRRFQAPLTRLQRAAAEVAAGRYETRVPVGDAGPELDALAESFNTLGAQLASTEHTRRRLLSDLAHELRTPIATLQAYLEGLDDGVRQWDQPTRNVLGDQVTRLARLASDLDSVSRAEEGQLQMTLEPATTAELVRAARDAVTARYEEKDMRIDVIERGPGHVAVDRTRFLQVLTNLLDNARRHTPRGGTVTIDTHAEDDWVTICITDTGDGISQSQLAHIFERFYRGDTARTGDEQGSGIGLTISRAIVEAHGGRLDAYSRGPGMGSTFTLKVPALTT